MKSRWSNYDFLPVYTWDLAKNQVCSTIWRCDLPVAVQKINFWPNAAACGVRAASPDNIMIPLPRPFDTPTIYGYINRWVRDPGHRSTFHVTHTRRVPATSEWRR